MSIRISRFRIDMGANPIKNLGQGTSTTDAARRDETVLMTGDQTVAGVKTFSSSPVFPSGTINAGDNLLLNPEFQVGATANLPLYWVLEQTPTLALVADTLFPALGGNQLTMTATGTVDEGIKILHSVTNWLKVKPSTTYTFSVDYKVTAGDNLRVVVISANGATLGTYHLNINTLSSIIAIRYSATFTTDADANNLYIQLAAHADGDIVVVSHPKLEEGSITTPFKPAYIVESSVLTGWIEMGSFPRSYWGWGVTVPAGAASIYQKGDKIRYKQNAGTWVYGYLGNVTDAGALSIVPNTSYPWADEAYTDFAYSHIENPLNFPDWFNYTPTVTWSGGTTDPGAGTNTTIFSIHGKMLTYNWFWYINPVGAGGNRTACAVTIPTAMISNTRFTGASFKVDTGVVAFCASQCITTNNYINISGLTMTAGQQFYVQSSGTLPI